MKATIGPSGETRTLLIQPAAWWITVPIGYSSRLRFPA